MVVGASMPRPTTTVVAAVPLMSYRKAGEAHMCFEVSEISGALISAKWTIHRTVRDFMQLHVEATRQGLLLPPLPALRGFRKQNAFQELSSFCNRVLALPAASHVHACAAFFELTGDSDEWVVQYSHLALAATTVQKYARSLLARQTVARDRIVRTAAKALQRAARESRRRRSCQAAAESPRPSVESVPDGARQLLAPVTMALPIAEGWHKPVGAIWWLDLVGAAAPVKPSYPEHPMHTWDGSVGAAMLRTYLESVMGIAAPPVSCLPVRACAGVDVS